MCGALERPVRRTVDVVVREVAGQTLLVPIRGQLADLQDLFVLNEVGAWLWPLLDGSRTAHDLATAVAAEFEVDEAQAAEDVLSFLRRLNDAGLLVMAQE